MKYSSNIFLDVPGFKEIYENVEQIRVGYANVASCSSVSIFGGGVTLPDT
jgi:hypothetical protein